MAAIPASVAQDLMWRSMTTGAPAAEMAKWGGSEAVAKAYADSGGVMNISTIPAARLKELANIVAQTGTGNLLTLQEANVPMSDQAFARVSSDWAKAGIDTSRLNNFTAAGLAAARRGNTTLTTGSSNSVLGNTGGSDVSGISGGGFTGGGGLTNGGTGVNTGGSSFMSAASGTAGVVYGPDGTMYSSPAAALAAGVKSFSTTKPIVQSSNSLLSPAGTPGTAAGGFMLGAAQTGNANPGGLIANANQQLFKNKVGVQMPPNY